MKITRRQIAGLFGSALLQSESARAQNRTTPLKALQPGPGGIQFVVYADSTSGLPGGPNALDLSLLNRQITRLAPAPGFIAFPGDQIAGAADPEAHAAQWRYFLEQEMAPITRAGIPVYHTTSNHDNFVPEHDRIFRQAMPGLPQNGPAGEEGLEYWVRRNDVLLVAVNMHSPRRGYGRMDTGWIDRVLTENHDARFKLVTAHLPAYTVNGYGFMNCNDEDGQRFKELLRTHGVRMYLCSHVLAFDFQARQGTVQLTTGCASHKGGGGLMPDATEYPHFVQVALDDREVRFQTIDIAGAVREWGLWPAPEAPRLNPLDSVPARLSEQLRGSNPHGGPGAHEHWHVVWRFTGTVPPLAEHAQTLLAGFMGLNVTFEESSMRLTVNLAPERDRGWERWTGPRFEPGQRFSFEILMYSALGPGGILFRNTGEKEWNSMETRSARGLEKFSWPGTWWIGRGQDGERHEVWTGSLPSVEWSYPRVISYEEVFGL